MTLPAVEAYANNRGDRQGKKQEFKAAGAAVRADSEDSLDEVHRLTFPGCAKSMQSHVVAESDNRNLGLMQDGNTTPLQVALQHVCSIVSNLVKSAGTFVFPQL
jgi:hypothetical protein